MKTTIHERVESARAGTNPTVVCRVPSGWVVMGDIQIVHGYSLLLPDPVVVDINSLDKKHRIQFLQDMVIIGDALLEVTDAYRINYEIQGNNEPALHAHIFPRYMSEPEELRKIPAWSYERSKMPLEIFDADRDKALMKNIAHSIQRRLK
jgi:diadenosine tetraphosphate (Ap4A) HIT family hydrolase